MLYHIVYNEDECYKLSRILENIIASTVMDSEDKEQLNRLAEFLFDATVMTISNREEAE